jgi:hypothetical protein
MDLLRSSRRMKREYFETAHNSFHILLHLLLHPVEEYYSERYDEEETIQNQVESDMGRKKKKNVRQINDFCIYNNTHITT